MRTLLILADGMRPDALTNIEKAQNIIARSKSTMTATHRHAFCHTPLPRFPFPQR